jgi:ParB-like chromosome segregation protein Spo0J
LEGGNVITLCAESDELPADHPIAAVFPLLPRRIGGVRGQHELNDLADDIKEHGLREPIVLFEGKILDGRNRARACKMAEVAPRFETYQGNDPVAFVVSKNLRRRHLNISQRAMIAAKLAKITWGGNRKTKLPSGHLNRACTAAGLDVGYRTVSRAANVLEHGIDDLVEAVENGKVTIAKADRIAFEPKAEQKQHLENHSAPPPRTKEQAPQAPPPTLDPNAWLRATAQERAAFVAAIGLEEFWLAADPSLRRAWIAKRRQCGGFV